MRLFPCSDLKNYLLVLVKMNDASSICMDLSSVFDLVDPLLIYMERNKKLENNQ